MKVFFKSSILIIVSTLLLFVVAEGISSLSYFIWSYDEKETMAETLHVEYDPLLGWINKPNVFIEDMYGPEVYLKTNSQRFRNKKDFHVIVPNNENRFICAGDSFTFGYGVSNDQAWCNLLDDNFSDLQTINMGQGGYGVDQAFLRYLRDGNKLNHDLLIFAFISGDFIRMKSSKSWGYPKPLLKLQDGKIIKENVPVPRQTFLDKNLPQFKEDLKKLRIVKMYSIFKDSGETNTFNILANKGFSNLILKIFGKLHNSADMSDRTVLFVHLPTQQDYESSFSDELTHFLRKNSQKNGWHYFNLIKDLRARQPHSVPELFIRKDLPGYVGSAGHYTEEGNQFIKELIIEKMSNIRDVAHLLQ